MKELKFRRSINQDKSLKNFSVCQESEDKRSVTKIRKSFIYLARHVEQASELNAPEIFIKKCVDNERMVESFRFKVKGLFYLTHNRMLIEVRFCHTLKIGIYWKAKYFSPKKSVVLTK
ncbi:MAG: hypothetical protein HQL26_03200 [Candidatus Omnitrophica bacterium]|nr:hypothetical protein [Candidatus Omnitrophota bacterium]